ncbi:MAG TPA: hypothetical protein VIG33_05550 [Pseudobdellovibrionaceae bacterium]
MKSMLIAIFMVQLIGNLKAFANTSNLIGQAVVCSRVLGVLGSSSGIATEYKDGYLILKNTEYNGLLGTYYAIAKEADANSCKIISEQYGGF